MDGSASCVMYACCLAGLVSGNFCASIGLLFCNKLVSVESVAKDDAALLIPSVHHRHFNSVKTVWRIIGIAGSDFAAEPDGEDVVLKRGNGPHSAGTMFRLLQGTNHGQAGPTDGVACHEYDIRVSCCLENPRSPRSLSPQPRQLTHPTVATPALFTFSTSLYQPSVRLLFSPVSSSHSNTKHQTPNHINSIQNACRHRRFRFRRHGLRS